MKFLKKITFEQKKWIFEAYMAGMAFFVGGILLAQSYLEIAIVVAILKTFVNEPLLRAITHGNKADEGPKSKFRFLKNLLYALIISSLIMLLYQYVMPILIEPISFGLLYKVFDSLIQKIIRKIRR
ncbi:hypothetical protein [Clostridium grantii]|nr:hypothetical protein [Clostridium grantii]